MYKINFADDWIQTADLRTRKRPLYQLSHNHCPRNKYLIRLKYLIHKIGQTDSCVDHRVNCKVEASAGHEVKILEDGQGFDSRRQAWNATLVLLLNLCKRDDSASC